MEARIKKLCVTDFALLLKLKGLSSIKVLPTISTAPPNKKGQKNGQSGKGHANRGVAVV